MVDLKTTRRTTARHRRWKAGRLFIGTSGYVYRHWRARFYPRSLPPSAWLGHYAAHFCTVELNSPFYRLPQAETFENWRRAVPSRFIFAVKASRFLTHVKRLRDPAGPLELLLARAHHLADRLGPILFQLPGHFHRADDRLDGLLTALRRQRRVPGLRAVLEVRHPSWLVDDIFGRLAGADVALCLTDWRDATVNDVVTADFVYVRRHASGRRYGGRYSEAALRADAERIRQWLVADRDVYVYFNNDARAYAVENALRLNALLARAAITCNSA